MGLRGEQIKVGSHAVKVNDFPPLWGWCKGRGGGGKCKGNFGSELSRGREEGEERVSAKTYMTWAK